MASSRCEGDRCGSREVGRGANRSLGCCDADTWWLGRSPENDIVVPEYSLSAQHCGFTYNAQYCEVVDFESRNGTILNGTPLKPGDVVRVKDKDTLVMGRLKFRLLFRGSLAKLVKSMPRMSSRSR